MTTCQLFTAKDANKTLPLVKKIVADILATGTDIRDRSERCGDGFENNPEYKRLFAELRELLAELEAIGCVYKDFNFSVGLVDFPGMIDDEEVYLCWRSDEPEIRYYHPIEAGYASRAPIPEQYL